MTHEVGVEAAERNGNKIRRRSLWKQLGPLPKKEERLTSPISVLEPREECTLPILLEDCEICICNSKTLILKRKDSNRCRSAKDRKSPFPVFEEKKLDMGRGQTCT
ncbi:hypothetical protein L2E82_37572 [Cichorium intybus]|uniref:Uncharacterized protein n=1 Tax=Cichorium intybus TaxID=13427 RepID=A0ACB9AEX9_CICIN|nr:hypothetical protein L2E82_37572 [Cichorium intybus]